MLFVENERKTEVDFLERLVEEGAIDKSSDNNYYIERYFDYYDELSSDQITNLIASYYGDGLEATNISVKDYVYDEILDLYYITESVLDFIDPEIIKKVSEELKINRSKAIDILIDNVFVEYDIDSLISRTTLDINIVPKSDEWNVDYTSIAYENYEETAFNDFVLKYCKKSIREILSMDYKDMKHREREIYDELYNITSSYNAFIIMISMRANEFLSVLSKEADYDKILIRNARAGLIDFINGAGSILGIEINSDIEYAIEDIDLEVDGMYGYGVKDIYGMSMRDSSDYKFI